MAKARTVLELRVGPLTESGLRVRRVRGHEALSRPWLFEVEFEPHADDPLQLADLVGAEAQLSLRRSDGPERLLHGVAEAVELLGVKVRRPLYRLRLVPRLALLAHTEDSRVFQELSVPEIVKKVLDEAQVPHAFGEKRQGDPGGLTASYPKREFCVQYRESDLAFVSRLLEEEGIFTLFDQADGSCTLVMGDAPGAFKPIAGDARLPFGEPEARDGDLEHVHATAREERVRTERVTQRDFDFLRPGLQIEEPLHPPRAGELDGYGYRLGYGDPGPLKRLSRVRLEEARSDADLLEARSSCLRLSPGRTVEITGAPAGRLGGKLQLLWVGCDAAWEEGADSASYQCSFLAQQAGAAWRPPQRTPRPVLAGTQTAAVVGPAGEEIHLDKHGRVKLLFHWDRLGKRDDKASCFVRVAQPWAGPGWGALRIPRIGQEAVVRFLDGDPDRPLVVGAVFNGALVPPIHLPDDKTRSTLRSDSSLGGGGFNELRFEDQKGQEELFLHAQKDENIRVEDEKRSRVRHDEALQVGKDRSRTVQGEQRLRVALQDLVRVGGAQTLTVGGARTVSVLGDESEQVGVAAATSVGGNQVVTVKAASSALVGAAAALNVGGVYAITVGGAFNEAVGGVRASQVGGMRVEVVVGPRDETVEKGSERAIGGDEALVLEQSAEVEDQGEVEAEIGAKDELEIKESAFWEGKKVKLEADEVRLVVGGKLLVELKKGGDVTIGAAAFTVEGSSDLGFKGSQIQMESAGSAPSASASVAQLKSEEPPKPVSGTMSDESGGPFGGIDVEVTLPGEGPVTKSVPKDGNFSAGGAKPGTVKIGFPGVEDPKKLGRKGG